MSNDGYTAEAAAKVIAQAFTSHEGRNSSVLTALSSGDWTHRVEEAIDLAIGLPQLSLPIRRQVLRFAFQGEGPGTVDGRFPDPQAVATKLEQPLDREETAVLKRELREVRASRSLALAMNRRRARAPILTEVDKRLIGQLCVRCEGLLELGQAIFLDRDWRSAWHVAGGCPA